MPTNPQNDNLGSHLLSGRRNPNSKHRKYFLDKYGHLMERREPAEPKEKPTTYAELDEAHWRIQEIWGDQD